MRNTYKQSILSILSLITRRISQSGKAGFMLYMQYFSASAQELENRVCSLPIYLLYDRVDIRNVTFFGESRQALFRPDELIESLAGRWRDLRMKDHHKKEDV